MVASKIIADLLVGRENPWAKMYSPWRTGKLISMAIDKTKDALKSLTKGKHLCSHMGCRLIYNEQEQTHDCPCHGSRFDVNGEILWGPAVKPILGAKKR
jgi:Rieske Fe-S protein